ncbi:unnamed protein product [Aphanomyces euteiches]
MTIQVQVQAAPGRAVSPRIIPLELSLLYDSGEVVQASASATSPSSGILKLFPDLRPNITDGNVRISFRIEDVSKNHQNHSFMLKIAPESSNVYADIASVCTAPVAIRSKRNKRRLAGLKSPKPNIFLTPAKPHTPSPAEATAAKPMMTMEMYLQVMNMANNNANAQIFTQESCVAYIWAQMQSDMRGDKMGLAAFDQYRQLIGFYKENQDVTQQEQQQQRPQMVFSPLSEFPFCDTTAICSGLESAVQYGSPAVFALSKYMGNLVKLQEEALMHYWSQNLMQ